MAICEAAESAPTISVPVIPPSERFALGRTEQARELAERELEMARTFQAPISLGRALHAAASLEKDREAVELLGEAVETLERSENRLAPLAGAGRPGRRPAPPQPLP
jgi:hypothetical protein